MPKKALVTGATGFVGLYLVDRLINDGYEVRQFDTSYGDDIRNYEQVRKYLDNVRPNVVFHLAAQAYVPESFSSPQRAFEVNTIGSTNILEAVRQLGLKTTVVLAGTSEEYGDGKPEEGAMLAPKSPYAISKVAMDLMGQLYAKAYGMHIVVTRAFNHTGPGRGEQYAESSFAKQVAEVMAGLRDTVEHGNLESVRNYTDVRDMVKAYVMASELESGVYNICSDRNVTMADVLDILIKHSGQKVDTKINPSLYRPYDFSFTKPNCKEFQKLTGWKPVVSLENTLLDLLEYWRDRV
jgi:GDP-4-dehydro-6-deoxy-D-mannose reductase